MIDPLAQAIAGEGHDVEVAVVVDVCDGQGRRFFQRRQLDRIPAGQRDFESATSDHGRIESATAVQIGDDL